MLLQHYRDLKGLSANTEVSQACLLSIHTMGMIAKEL